MSKYLDIRIVGGEEEIKELVQVLGVIQWLGEAGANRQISVRVDGDGSARLQFFINGEKLKTPRIKTGGELPAMYIGE